VTLLRRFTPVAHRLDHVIGRLSPRREVLVELRTPVYHAVLSPIADALAHEAHLNVWFTSEHPARVRDLVPTGRFLTHAEAEWRRFDVYINGDPWAAVRLRRCARRVNFFHGVAGKYDLDNPKGLPLGFEYYDRVGFINRDRMRRYLAAEVVQPAQAKLVGYPKLDKLANQDIEVGKVKRRYALDGRPTALYAPTYSDASSLHLAGTDIARTLDRAGFNVLIKLHDRSLDPDPRYNLGIDWRARFAEIIERSGTGRVHFVETADATPLLAAADVMITDHSSIGFEFLLLDRPLIVFDAPDLPVAARVNMEKVTLLRSAATVARTADETARAASCAVANPAAQSDSRRRVAREMFFEPGTATARAVHLVRELLYPTRVGRRTATDVEAGGTS
jgi:CDP-Glycerol:Poly(glycerophosphate) glycerophosphotransferase